MANNKPQVAIVMGSDSDWPVMKAAAQMLADFGVEYEARVVSAAIIAGAGGAAHLPGMIAAKTTIPVLGVPVPSKHLQGEDSLFSIVQMPKGVPVATFAIGEAGAANAGLFAVSILATTDANLADKLEQFRKALADKVLAMTLTDQP